MDASDTHIGKDDSDTVCLGAVPGQQVQIIAGPLKGSTGTVIERRPGGRYLVRLERAVYVEISKICLEGKPQK